MIASALGLIVLMIAAVALCIRRGWLRTTGIERQLEEFRTQVRDQLQVRDEAEYRQGQDTEAEIRRVRHELSGKTNEVLGVANRISTATAALRDRVADVSNQISNLADVAELILRKDRHSCPVDSSVLETKTEDELLAVAESVAFLRALVPYPKWRFDADLANPDLALEFRRWLWQSFNDRKREDPVVVPWHDGTRLRVFLGMI